MKRKEITIQQYAFQTKNLDGPSDEFLEQTAPLIGFIVHSFNTLEDCLNEAICNLINDRSDMHGLLVIHKMNYASKVDLFRRFLLEMQNDCDKEIPKLDKLFENLKTAGNLRNQVVHADWESAYDDGYTRCKLKINSKGISHEYIQFTPDSLQSIIDLINDTYDMFDDYETEMGNLWRQN